MRLDFSLLKKKIAFLHPWSGFWRAEKSGRKYRTEHGTLYRLDPEVENRRERRRTGISFRQQKIRRRRAREAAS